MEYSRTKRKKLLCKWENDDRQWLPPHHGNIHQRPASNIKKWHNRFSQDWFAVGDYKERLNTVGGLFTAQPAEVAEKIRILIAAYNAKKEKSFDDLLDFHYRFERIHPFQDGGRLLLFKECLRYNLVPFIIDEELKMFYYRGLHEWENERDICATPTSPHRINSKNISIISKSRLNKPETKRYSKRGFPAGL